ncbi:protein phosphatase 2c [Podospora didyma]|uniref:Mannosyl-oligosaccharide glucosidase n=1 Tax=Podospora didyma TaxID=330526 RepID=A0AAE0NST3_9PEZI|nr:protein phosphatase 2c [Podospora didyma]
MRRAAAKALRTTIQCTVRGLRVNRRGSVLPSRTAAYARYLSSSSTPPARSNGTSSPSKPDRVLGEPLQSSMYFRRASFALVSALVGYGAWYSYNGDSTDAVSRAYSTSASSSANAAAPTRSVLVIGADELQTGTFVGEGPISKTTDNDGRRVLEMLTPEQATEKLRKSEQSYFVNRGQGVLRYDMVQLPSNDPIEDDHAEKIVEMPSSRTADGSGSSDWMFWGVFDGHSGWTTSAKLRQTLISFVARELNDTYKAASGLTPSQEAVESAIKTGFLRLDDEIVHQSVQKVLQSNNKIVGAEMLAPALSGSCALLSFYDSRSKLLRVACTGDSRAVLGRRSSSGKWTATALSVDQTGSNPDEAARLRKLHPGEEHVVRNGRVLGGLEPTRAFGDASYKWTRDIADKLRQQFFGRTVSPLLKTPPYVTAEPVVTTTKIEPEKGDFVVMATDGLWEMLTTEEVVGLVGKWIESQASSTTNSQFDSVWSRVFGSQSAKLPVEPSQGAKGGDADGQKTPIRLRQWGVSPDEMDRFVVKDKNVATHLIRNALGGKNQEQVSALLTLPSPYSRRYRDDLTVQVIFFGYSEKTGEVLVNNEATAEANKGALKAKLPAIMVVLDNHEYTTEEEKRLKEDRNRIKYWKKWGPYVSERQWATVREDYSADGDAWSHFTHDDARSRAFRWGEDGIAGVCDTHGFQNIAFAFWNEKDPFLKERLFGLSNPQGNHGESLKEAHFHLDNTPHSYMKYLYKYPQNAFPYEDLLKENARRGKEDKEYQLLDTGIFEEDRYWDIFIETAKEDDDPEELLFRVTAWNRGPDPAPLHIIPLVWFRNTWAWGREAVDKKPSIQVAGENLVKTKHHSLGERNFLLSPSPGVGPSGEDVEPKLMFTENDTNYELLYGGENPQPYVKDAFHRYIVDGEKGAVNPAQIGTKCAAQFAFNEDGGVKPGECAVVRFRISRKQDTYLDEEEFDDIIERKREEADEFYYHISPLPMADDLRNIQRQAFAGMMWCKQHYLFIWDEWANGDPSQPPPPPDRKGIRNSQWKHLHCDDILSMPDSWEYPFFAAWDTSFHCITLAMIDPDFAKKQLDLFTREWYCHPNGQLPAYEWNFGDVNPPVHAWATFRVFKIERKMYGRQDLDFLERVFQKLLMNFTWWVNRKDVDGKNVFEGGFLGLDNIGLFNRSEPLPTGGTLEQADSTGWMAFYCLNMLNIALELAKHRRIYEDIASKFFEHFILISDAMTFRMGQKDEKSLWNDEDGFYYDAISWGGPWIQQLPVRSLVGLIPLYATLTLEPELINKLPNFKKRVDWFIENRCDVAERTMHSIAKRGKGNRILLSLVSKDRLVRILERMLNEDEFFSPHGIRSMSKHHKDHPFSMEVNGQTFKVGYVPGDSDSGLFGGNSNWRGPIWLCVNFLLVESLQRFYLFFGQQLQVECPVGSGDMMHLGHVSEEIQHRLQHLMARGDDGRRSINAGNDTLDFDPNWRDYLWFYEFFDGDSGRGLGATHQCGWTGLIARMIHDTGVNCRLPQTPRTPSVGMSHYFDDIFHRHAGGMHTPKTPGSPNAPRLRRSSTSRSIAARSDFDGHANGYDEDEEEADDDVMTRRGSVMNLHTPARMREKAEADAHLHTYISQQLERVKLEQGTDQEYADGEEFEAKP